MLMSKNDVNDVKMLSLAWHDNSRSSKVCINLRTVPTNKRYFFPGV